MISNMSFGNARRRSAARRMGRGFRTKPHNRRASRRLLLEHLEHRMLLSVTPAWVFGVGGPPNVTPNDTAVGGPNGNVYVAGSFEGEVNFNPHGGNGSDILTSAGGSDGFVAQYTSAGDFVSAIRMGGPSGDVARGIDVDKDGNIYVTGSFHGTADFGGQPLTAISPCGSVFIARFNGQNGVSDWSVVAGGDYDLPKANPSSAGMDIAVDDRGDAADWCVYVTGYFKGRGQFGSDSPKTVPSYANEGFVSKLQATGEATALDRFIWTRTFGGKWYDVGRGIALDNSGGATDVYLTGSFADQATFGSERLRSAGYDIFVSKLDDAGNFLWARQMGTNGGDIGYAIAVHDGAAYVTGSFGGGDVFVEKVGADGTILWATQAGGPEEASASGYGISVDPSQGVFVTGSFQGSVSFDNSYPLTSAGYRDGFLWQLSGNGNSIDAWRMGGESNGDEGYGVAIDAGGNVYTTGAFRQTADFPTEDVLSAESGTGMYLLKFAVQDGNSPPVIDNITVEPQSGTEDEAIVFKAFVSDDPSDPLWYNWDFGDGNTLTTTLDNVSYAYLWGGTFNVTLTVNDGKGGTATGTTSATVEEVNDDPVADPGGPYSAMEGTSIAFDGSASYDFDLQDGTTANDGGQVLTYEWDFEYDGVTFAPEAIGVTTSHTYAAAGVYTVGLKVSDGNGGTHIETTTATVTTAGWTIDDGDLGYSEDWTVTSAAETVVGDGYAGLDGVSDYRRYVPWTANNRVSWEFAGLGAGTYEVLVTWVAPSDGTNVPYEIHDGDNGPLVGNVRVNQRKDPVGEVIDGIAFQSLGTFTISSDTLWVVQVPGRGSLSSSTIVIDAVRVIPVSSGSSSAAQSTAPDTEAALAAALGTFDVSTNIGQLGTSMGPAPDAFANSRDAQTPNAVDGLFGSYAPAVDLLDLLVDDRFLPASHKRRGEDSAVDLVLGDIAASPFDQQLVEDLALALV